MKENLFDHLACSLADTFLLLAVRGRGSCLYSSLGGGMDFQSSKLYIFHLLDLHTVIEIDDNQLSYN